LGAQKNKAGLILTVQTLVEDFLQYLRHERGQSAATFLFAIRAGHSKV
jgi:hypothetical protein